MQFNVMTVWKSIEKYNLEAKAHEIWELTKDGENMDEVNNRLLRKEELGVKFFADIVYFMVQNGKAIDIEHIGFPDIVKLFHGDKYGYEHKIFQDMASLNGVDPADKVKAAIGIFTMKPQVKDLLILTLNHKKATEAKNLEGFRRTRKTP